jgi:hypothetical protein
LRVDALRRLDDAHVAVEDIGLRQLSLDDVFLAPDRACRPQRRAAWPAAAAEVSGPGWIPSRRNSRAAALLSC